MIEKFRFTADIVFDADGIDDAMEKVGKHLLADFDHILDFIGEIECEPVVPRGTK